jgi:hypothetical protein
MNFNCQLNRQPVKQKALQLSTTSIRSEKSSSLNKSSDTSDKENNPRRLPTVKPYSTKQVACNPNLLSFQSSAHEAQSNSQESSIDLKCLSKLVRTSLSGMHKFVDFVFRDSDASKKISQCTNSKHSALNSSEKLQSSADERIYYEEEEESRNVPVNQSRSL